MRTTGARRRAAPARPRSHSAPAPRLPSGVFDRPQPEPLQARSVAAAGPHRVDVPVLVGPSEVGAVHVPDHRRNLVLRRPALVRGLELVNALRAVALERAAVGQKLGDGDGRLGFLATWRTPSITTSATRPIPSGLIWEGRSRRSRCRAGPGCWSTLGSLYTAPLCIHRAFRDSVPEGGSIQ